MKKLLICTCTVFAFFVTAAVAQTSSPSDPTTPNTPAAQGSQSSSPSMGQQGTTPDSTPGSMSQGSMSGNSTNSTVKPDKTKMKGCIQSQGGQYMLQTRHGKSVMLSGQDVSAHVGHEVTVHGMWEAAGGNMSGMSNTASGSASAASGKSFNVSSVDMISDTCSMGKGMSNDKGSGTGMSGSGTTPPQ
jgi:Protein of unknown function (DUF5818)